VCLELQRKGMRKAPGDRKRIPKDLSKEL